MNPHKTRGSLLCLICFLYLSTFQVDACRVSSEKLKLYAQRTIDHLLDVSALESFYWRDEPLPHESLSKITGLNITLVETHFNMTGWRNSSRSGAKLSMLQDVSVTCSMEPDRSYTLTINLELKNPFDRVDFNFGPSDKIGNKENAKFNILLPKSTFNIQLNQHIRYDECLDVNYVQLSQNPLYSISCDDCDEKRESNLNKMFQKKIIQLDAELDLILSDKILLGLQNLLSEQRLDLDLYLN